jgi:hypothetical protein
MRQRRDLAPLRALIAGESDADARGGLGNLRRIFLHAAGDDPERAVRKRPLQLDGLVRRRGHPGLNLVGSQDHRHRLWVDRADLSVRLRRQEREDVVRSLALLDLPDRRPVGPDAGEAGERAGLIEREPDVAALFERVGIM